ncbi:MAG: exodeoxyribonuclease III, partial [Gammaproteobacteria bacterium]|nr:exodeoxyribonuclease III [Gammaproteobacteria bacterium]
QIGSPGLNGVARSAGIYKDGRFSDHAPLSMDYAFD